MNRSEFYNTLRARVYGGSLSQKQVDGIEALLAATEGLPITYRSYLMATALHETAHTMQPIAEYGKGKGRPYGAKGKHGQAQYGRGYVQLTWDANYEKADKALGLKGALLKDFNLAMQPTIAAKILVRGCVEGWFTGKKLGDYLPADYVGARRVVNGTDRAAQIADYARGFEAALALAHVNETPKPEHVAPVVLTKSRFAWVGEVLAGLFAWLAKLRSAK